MKTWQDLINSNPAFKQAAHFLAALTPQLDQKISLDKRDELIAALKKDIPLYEEKDHATNDNKKLLQRLLAIFQTSVGQPVTAFIHQIQSINKLIIQGGTKAQLTRVLLDTTLLIAPLVEIILAYNSAVTFWRSSSSKPALDAPDTANQDALDAIDSLLADSRKKSANNNTMASESYFFNLEDLPGVQKRLVYFESPIDFYPSDLDKIFFLSMQEAILRGLSPHLSQILTARNVYRLYHQDSPQILQPSPTTLAFTSYFDTMFNFIRSHPDPELCLFFFHNIGLKVEEYGLNLMRKKEHTQAIEAFSFVIDQLIDIAVWVCSLPQEKTLQQLNFSKKRCIEYQANASKELAKPTTTGETHYPNPANAFPTRNPTTPSAPNVNVALRTSGLSLKPA